jgi:CRISPR/Cas system-associated exonuclease Cas4 (RecB family)
LDQDQNLKIKQTSFTRLNLYNECPRKYKNKYILKIQTPVEVEDYFLKGRLVHTLLESFFIDTDLNLDFIDYLPEFITKECKLPITEDYKDMQTNQAIHIPSLVEYADKVSNLLLRTAENYKGNDSIRNSDGSVPKDVWSYQPKAFKTEYRELGVDSYRYAIDLTASKLDTNYEKFSLAFMVADALFNVKNFTKPNWLASVVDQEYRFEDKGEKVLFNNNTLYWSGGPDLRVKTHEGDLVILDYKTSKSKPSKEDVLWHMQLALYAYLTFEQTKELAKAVGIIHLPSNDIILAGVDPLIVSQTIKYLEDIQDAINKEVFPKKHPTEFNSPCIKRDWKTKLVTKVCPYLKTCWPEYHQDVIEYYESKPNK